MDLTLEINAFKPLVTQANNIVILLPVTASKDGVASALSLYLSLMQMQKKVSVIYEKDPIVDWSYLVGLDKLSKATGGNKNFVISIDYLEGSIEKVSYNIDNNKFNLVIEPKAGAPEFDETKVTYTHTGFDTDLIIVVEASTLASLGKIYTDNKSLFDSKNIVSLSNQVSASFGKINFVRPTSSVSEITAVILNGAQMPVDNDIASNIYAGIASGSVNFTHPEVGASTFEAAAWALNLGARKPIIQEETPKQEFAVRDNQEANKPPPDWLKPKIFKGGSLL